LEKKSLKMTIIKNLFEKKIGETEHLQFIRFGKGTYKNRFYIKIKKNKRIKIKSGFESVNDLIRIITQNIQTNAKVKGKVFSKKDFKEGLFENKEKKKGFYVGTIDKELFPNQLKELYEEFKNEHLLLNIQSEEYNLKTNSSLYNPRGSYKENFATFETTNFNAVKSDFLFDLPDKFKEIELKHDIFVEEIIIPKEYENNAELARIHGKRKGKLIRKITIDEKEVEKELDFEV